MNFPDTNDRKLPKSENNNSQVRIFGQNSLKSQVNYQENIDNNNNKQARIFQQNLLVASDTRESSQHAQEYRPVVVAANAAPARFELSPTPSADLSTSINSFYSLGHEGYINRHQAIAAAKSTTTTTTTTSVNDDIYHIQSFNGFKQDINNSSDNNYLSADQLLPVPYRHSSSSIDHKSLNLTRFSQAHHLRLTDNHESIKINCLPLLVGDNQFVPTQDNCCHQQQQQQAYFEDPNRSEHYANYVINTARRSDSFQKAIRAQSETDQRPVQFFKRSSKRSSVNYSLNQPANYPSLSSVNSHSLRSTRPHLQRHLLSPVPQPPRPPPNGHALSLTEDLPLTTTSDSRTFEHAKMSKPPTGNNTQDMQQQLGADSLDNIQMIVDEENFSYNNNNVNLEAQKSLELPFDGEGTIRPAHKQSKSEDKIASKSTSTTNSILKQQQPSNFSPRSHSTVSFSPGTQEHEHQHHHHQHHQQQQQRRDDFDNQRRDSNGPSILRDVEHVVQFDDLSQMSQQLEGNVEPTRQVPLGAGQQRQSNRSNQHQASTFVFSEVRKYPACYCRQISSDLFFL